MDSKNSEASKASPQVPQSSGKRKKEAPKPPAKTAPSRVQKQQDAPNQQNPQNSSTQPAKAIQKPTQEKAKDQASIPQKPKNSFRSTRKYLFEELVKPMAGPFSMYLSVSI